MNLRQDDSQTRRWITIFVVIVAIILIIAAIGYLSGNWDTMPP